MSYARNNWNAAEIKDLIEARTHQFMIGEISEVTFVASLFGLRKHRDEIDGIVRDAKQLKHDSAKRK